MKKHLLTLLSIFILANAYAQKFELSVNANSGLYHFSGKSSTSTSFINGGGSADAYTNNPYGSKNGFSYGGALQGQFVSKNGFIVGLQAGYDILRAKVNITQAYPDNLPYTNYVMGYTFPAKGTTFLTGGYINLNPYIGYRLHAKKINIDLLPGMDIGINKSERDKGQATTTDNGTVYKVDRDLGKGPADIRLRFGAVATYNKIGINASFAHGITNFESHVIGDASYNVQSELVRFGITYRIL